MSDNEIIKNLKYCCLIDPKTIFIRNDRTGEITALNMNDVLNLINRLQAELKVSNEALNNSIKLNNRLETQNKELSETVHNLTLEKDGLFDKAEELKAEVERSKKKVEELSEVLSDSIRIRYKEAKSEAIKEFADILKDSFFDNGYESPDVDFDYFVDNLVKEMIGDDNA